jgi:tetratricopeptide (TPR) repeat protein
VTFLAKLRAKRHCEMGSRVLLALPPSSSTLGALGKLPAPLLKTLYVAIQHLRKAVILDPDSADAYYYLSVALFELGEYRRLVKAIKEAKLEAALSFYVNTEQCRYVPDSRYLKLNNYDFDKATQDIKDIYELALGVVDRAILLRNGFSKAYNTRARILSRLGRLSEAMDAVNVALAQDPDCRSASDNRENIAGLMKRETRAQVVRE